MKIISKEEYSQTTHYSIEAIDDKGDKIIATLILYWDNNLAVPEYSFEIIEGGKDLINKDIADLKELAIDYNDGYHNYIK